MAAALLQAVPVPSRFRRARAPPGLAAMGQRKYRQSLKVTIVVLSYYDIVVHESRKHDMICTETCFCYQDPCLCRGQGVSSKVWFLSVRLDEPTTPLRNNLKGALLLVTRPLNLLWKNTWTPRGLSKSVITGVKELFSPLGL